MSLRVLQFSGPFVGVVLAPGASLSLRHSRHSQRLMLFIRSLTYLRPLTQ
jgi:hypothetical protein